MGEFGLLVILLVGLFVIYKLGLFNPAVNLANVATRASSKYDRDHKEKIARSYLGSSSTFTEEDITKINTNIKNIDDLKFD